MARRSVWLLSYENQDITDDIAPMVTSVTYTDHVHGKSDELEIEVEDGDQRWRNLWYPSEGDWLDLKMGYAGEALLPCGRFSIDEIELGHSARSAKIRALAVPLATPLRTQQTRAFDDVSLKDIIDDVASRYSLSVVGTVEALPFRRITQSQETDLAFLKRIAERYGYAFSIRGEQLVFYPLLELEAAETVITLPNRDLLPGTTFKGSAQKTYTACEFSYIDPETGELIRARVEADGIRRGSTNPTATTAATQRPVAPNVILREGSPHTEEVRDWQRFLQGRGMYSGAIDGIFGKLTARGTRSFQHEQGLQTDAAVGPLTYAAAIDQGFLASTGEAGGVSAVGDVLRLNERVESAVEAEAVARAELHRANRLRANGTIELEGQQRCVAGAKITIPDAGRLAGDYLIDKSTHKITRGAGYHTQCEVSHVVS